MFLAIDIGGTNYKLALIGGDGQVHQLRTGSTDRAGGAAWMIARIAAEGLTPLRRLTSAYTMPVHRSLVRLEQARHPDQAVLLGAVVLAKELN